MSLLEVFLQVVIVKYFGASTQLHIVIGQMHHFSEMHWENWTRSQRRYQKVKRTFARNLWNVLYAIKINVVNTSCEEPPINRDTFNKLVVCYDFKPFHKHLSRPRKLTVERYKKTIKFNCQVHHATQEEMWEQI